MDSDTSEQYPAHFTSHAAEASGDGVRMETFRGSPHLVAPVVLVREGVLNGGFLPADAIEASAPGWNSVPVTAPPSTDSSGHPVDEQGNFTSANKPEVFEQYVIGRTFEVEYDPDLRGLVGEMWINLDRAAEVGDVAIEVARRLKDGEPLEVSTGYWHAVEEREGEFDGQAFEQVQSELLPDHLATLPNETGACSWADGCGAPRANALVSNMGVDTPAPGLGTDAEHGIMDRVNHAVHILTGQSDDCTCGGDANVTPTETGDGGTADAETSEPMEINYEHLADNSAFTADELREDEELAQKVHETVEANANTEVDSGGDADDDAGAESEQTVEGDGADVEADEADADADETEEPEAPAAMTAEDLAEFEERVAKRAAENAVKEMAVQTEREELVATITANSDKTEDDLADTGIKSLRLLAEMAEESAESAPKSGVNYLGRGVGAANHSEDDDYDVSSVGALATLSRRERKDKEGEE